MSEQASILDDSVLKKIAASITHNPTTMTMEALNQSYGYVLYRFLFTISEEKYITCTFDNRTTLTTGPLFNAQLSIQGFGDRANVFVDGNYVGVLQRDTLPWSLPITVNTQQARLDIIVENMGRIEFGNSSGKITTLT